MQKSYKITSFLFASLAACFIFTGCGDKKGSSSSATSSSSSDDAGSAAIEFHNMLIGVLDNARTPLNEVMKENEKSAAFAQDDGSVVNCPSWTSAMHDRSFTTVANLKLTAPKSFSKDDQEFFNSRLTTLKSDSASLQSFASTLNKYYDAEDYKDDKHKKFLDAQPKIEALVQKIAKNCAEMGDKSEEIASAAERETLKKNPIGIYVLNMRDITDKLGKQGEVLSDEDLYSSDFYNNASDADKAAAVAKAKPAVDAAEALATQISDMATKYKAQDRAALKGHDILSKDYDTFFSRLESAEGDLRKIIRNLKTRGYAGTPDEAKRVANAYENVQAAHNIFIGHVNQNY